MTTTIETLKDCAEEASFQLLCAKEHASWMLALALAIQMAHTNGKSAVAAELANLASYLGDSHGHITIAIQQFDELVEACAPQNATRENRGAHGESEQ